MRVIIPIVIAPMAPIVARDMPLQEFMQALSGAQPLAVVVSPAAESRVINGRFSGSPARTFEDLRGKKIGVSAPGSSTNMVASLVLSRGGIKPGEVTFVGVGTGVGALTAIRSGQVDALCNSDPVMTMLEQKGDIRVVADTRTLKGTSEVFGGAMPAGCLYAPRVFLEKNPNTAQALANAIVHSLKWLQTAGPSDLMKTVPEAYLLGDRGLYLASFDKVREAIALDGLIPEDGAKVALRALGSFEPTLKADKIDLAKTFTNEFAKKAKAKFKA